MTYVAVVSWTPENRVSKYAEFDSEAEAIDHFNAHGGFVATTPSGAPTSWLVDPDTDTLSSAPIVTVNDIVQERERRLAEGFDYDFGDERGVHRIATTKADMEGWDEVSKVATALSGLGDTVTTITIMTETGLASITATEWFSIAIAAGLFRQPIWAGSFALQAMDPIPADYATNDAYWS